ncbi:tetratricopeptide repeat protein [Symmachiella macrocystis]|nr:hypothetical protein [Symmachiella macrocystis]
MPQPQKYLYSCLFAALVITGLIYSVGVQSRSKEGAIASSKTADMVMNEVSLLQQRRLKADEVPTSATVDDVRHLVRHAFEELERCRNSRLTFREYNSLLAQYDLGLSSSVDVVRFEEPFVQLAVRAGLFDEAQEIVTWCTNADKNFGHLANLAEALIDNGHFDRATHLIATIDRPILQASLYLRMAKQERQLGDFTSCRSHLRDAAKTLSAIKDGSDDGRQSCEVAEEAFQCDYTEDVTKYYEQAIATADKIQDRLNKDMAYDAIVESLCRVGRVRKAEIVRAQIERESLYHGSSEQIAAALANKGELGSAIRVVEEIPIIAQKAQGYVTLAKIRQRAGDAKSSRQVLRKAYETVLEIESITAANASLRDIMTLWYALSLGDDMTFLFDTYHTNTKKEIRFAHRQYQYRALAELQASVLGMKDLALGNFRNALGGEADGGAWNDAAKNVVSSSMAQHGFPQEAESIANTISLKSQKRMALSRTAQGYAKEGNINAALRIWETADAADTMTKDVYALNIVVGCLSGGRGNEAHAVCNVINDEYLHAVALFCVCRDDETPKNWQTTLKWVEGHESTMVRAYGILGLSAHLSAAQ